MDRYFTQGDRAFKVYVYGADEFDPSKVIEPGSEHWSESDALTEARQMLESKIGQENGLWWNASVERGEWVAYSDATGFDWLDFETDEDVPLKWLTLVDGKVEPQE